jgi:hypothetical protein
MKFECSQSFCVTSHIHVKHHITELSLNDWWMYFDDFQEIAVPSCKNMHPICDMVFWGSDK